MLVLKHSGPKSRLSSEHSLGVQSRSLLTDLALDSVPKTFYLENPHNTATRINASLKRTLYTTWNAKVLAVELRRETMSADISCFLSILKRIKKPLQQVEIFIAWVDDFEFTFSLRDSDWCSITAMPSSSICRSLNALSFMLPGELQYQLVIDIITKIGGITGKSWDTYCTQILDVFKPIISSLILVVKWVAHDDERETVGLITKMNDRRLNIVICR